MDKIVISQINEYVEQMGDNFEALITSYFEDFKKAMKQRLRIPSSLVEKHVNEVCFLVDIDYTYIQVSIPRVRWLRPLGYEVNIDEASAAITALLAKEIDKSAPHFGTYDVIRPKVDMELKTSSTLKKKDKMVKKLKAKLGEGKAEGDEVEEESEGPLEITQGMGEDAEQEESDEEEAPKAEPKKRKEKKQPTAQPRIKKPATKPTLAKPTTRADTSKSAQEEKEPEKEKDAEQGEQPQKKRRKLIVSLESDDEGT